MPSDHGGRNHIEANGYVHGINPRQVKAVVFDLGGVFLEGTIENVVKFGKKVGLDESAWEQIRTELFLQGGDGLWDQLERGEITLEAFATGLQKRLAAGGVEIDLNEARNFMGHPEDTFEMRLRQEIVSACESVRAVMPTALLTNNIVEWRNGWRSRIDVDGLFNEVIDSSAVGMRKPETRIYKLMEQLLGQPGEELLFIDDLGVNLKPARKLGWQTLKYDDTTKVLQVLDAVVQHAG